MSLLSIIQSNNLDTGFTYFLGSKKGRFVVGITNNIISAFDKVSVTLLESQLKGFYKLQNLTIGGWKDSQTNKTYIDFGVAIDNLDDAKLLGKSFQQIAIWDMDEMKEVRL